MRSGAERRPPQNTYKQVWAWISNPHTSWHVLLLCSVLYLAEGLLASICWWDFERRELCETAAPPAIPTPARAPAVSALKLTRGYDGFLLNNGEVSKLWLRMWKSDSHNLHARMRLSSFIGMSKRESISSASSIVLKMDGATLARFELYYSSPKIF